jgi:hypothetical protein
MIGDTIIPKGFLDDLGTDGDDGYGYRGTSQAEEGGKPIANS